MSYFISYEPTHKSLSHERTRRKDFVHVPDSHELVTYLSKPKPHNTDPWDLIL